MQLEGVISRRVDVVMALALTPDHLPALCTGGRDGGAAVCSSAPECGRGSSGGRLHGSTQPDPSGSSIPGCGSRCEQRPDRLSGGLIRERGELRCAQLFYRRCVLDMPGCLPGRGGCARAALLQPSVLNGWRVAVETYGRAFAVEVGEGLLISGCWWHTRLHQQLLGSCVMAVRSAC
jgi:hypothetical protein